MLLQVVPTSLAVRAARERVLAREGVWLGAGPVALGTLVESFLEFGGLAPAPGQAALAEVASLVRTEAGLDPALVQPGLIQGLVSLWGRFSAAGLNWRATVKKISALDRAWLSQLARGFEAFQLRLQDLGLKDDQARAWQAGQICRREDRLPDLLLNCRGVSVNHVEDCSPAQIDLLAALAQRGLRVEVHLPFLAGQERATGNEASFRAFEALGELNADLEVIGRELDSHGPPEIRSLTAGLVGQNRRSVDPGQRLVRFTAPGRYAEMEAVGRRIRALLDRGVSPRRIGLVVRSLAGLTGQMIEDVGRRLRIPLDLRRGQPLAETGPVKVILAGLTLAGEGPTRA
ncbi:MAG: hypothetical protein JRJ59_10025, partial [Deltaproteobacteria bacterium]|nr:hypothetical protein [Deltaproteobacteria bacterium]